MTIVPDPASVELSHDEAVAHWCVLTATRPLEAAEKVELDRWLAADAVNGKALDEALAVWAALHSIRGAPEIVCKRTDALEAMRRANRNRWSRRLGKHWHWAAGLVASLVFAIMIGLSMMGAPTEEYVTQMGERRTVLLADGSRLSLDAETRVQIVLGDTRRELRLLSGRAKFDVVKDYSRPFTVTAADRTVVATGTEFSVELVRNQVHVIVYDGGVAVVPGRVPSQSLGQIKRDAARSGRLLTPGREFVSEISAPYRPIITSADMTRTISWENGQLNFVDEPLISAIERLNRYRKVKIIVGDAQTAAIRMNGVFNAVDDDTFTSAVVQIHPLQVRRDGGGIVLESR